MTIRFDIVNNTGDNAIAFIRLGPADLYIKNTCLSKESVFSATSVYNLKNPINSNINAKDNGVPRTVVIGNPSVFSFENGKAVSLYAKANSTLANLLIWLVKATLPLTFPAQDAMFGPFGLQDVALGAKIGLSKVELTLDSVINMNISAVDGMSHDVELSFTPTIGSPVSRLFSPIASPNPAFREYSAIPTSYYQPDIYGNPGDMKVLISDKFTAPETPAPLDVDPYGLGFTERELIAASDIPSKGFYSTIPLHQHMSHSLATKYILDAVSTPSSETFLGWLHRVNNSHAYSWAFDEINCLAVTCGYGVLPDQPDPVNNVSHKTFLSQNMGNPPLSADFSSYYATGSHRMLKHGVAGAPSFGDPAPLANNGNYWWWDGAPIPPDAEATNTWLEHSDVLVKTARSEGVLKINFIKAQSIHGVTGSFPITEFVDLIYIPPPEDDQIQEYLRQNLRTITSASISAVIVASLILFIIYRLYLQKRFIFF